MKVITVFKTHVDIGFTDLPSKVLKSYSTSLLSDVVTTCENAKDTHKPFIWTMPSYVLYYTLKNCNDELRKRTEKLISQGIITWHALPLTIRTEFFSGYELRKLFYYSDELCKRYNKPKPVSAKMTDVPGHTQALVDVLCENGVKFLHLGCNPASTHPDVPTLFFWESKNGNRILTFYDSDYGAGVVPPKDWKFPVYLCMNVTRDNVGVHDEGTIRQLEKELYEYDVNAVLETGSLDDFANEILGCDLSGIPVIKGELGDTWIHGLSAFPKACQAIGDVRRTFEKVSSFLESRNDTEFFDLQNEYIENVMLFGEHSGGVDVKKYVSAYRDNGSYSKEYLLQALDTEQFKYAQSGWNDEVKWALNAKSAALKLKEKTEKKYGVSFDKQPETNSEQYSIECDAYGINVVNNENGRKVTVSYLYEVVGRNTIDCFLDSYLTHKYNWALADFGRYRMDGVNTYPDVENMTFKPILKNMKKDGSTVCAEYVTDKKSHFEYGNCMGLCVKAEQIGEKVKITLIINNKQPTLYVEGGYVCFDINEKLTDLTVNKSGVDITPSSDVVKGANTAFFGVDKYVKVNGVTIEPVHTRLVCFGEPKVYRNNTKAFEEPDNGKVLFNIYNNMWATGSPQWVTGSFKFEYYLSF